MLDAAPIDPSSSSAVSQAVPSTVPLALPFAALGLCGGIIAAVFIGSVFAWGPANLPYYVVVMTPIWSGLLGWFVGKRIIPAWEEPAGASWFVRLLVATMAASAGNAVGICLVLMQLRYADAIVWGTVEAFFLGAPFLVAFAMVAAVALRARRARAGSLLAQSDERAVWLLTATIIGVSSTLTIVAGGPFQQPQPVLAGLLLSAVMLIPLLALCDVVALWRVRRSFFAGPGILLRTASLPAPTSRDRRYVDFGLGGEERVSTHASADPYREPDRTRLVCEGDPLAVAAALRSALVLDALSLLMVLAPPLIIAATWCCVGVA